MKALVYDGVETLGDRYVPVPAKDEHLIRVEAGDICGFDMRAYLGHDARRLAELILGDEVAGAIVGGPKDGMRVTVNPLVTCGTCTACTSARETRCPNGQIISMKPCECPFAQFISMPMQNLVEVPQDVPLAKAALAGPLAVGWQAIRLATNALHPTSERRALVIGCGTIGLAALLALKAMAVADVTIVEPNDAQRVFLTDTCGEHVVASAEGQFSLVVDAVGDGATRTTASACTAPWGVIAHVGLGEDMRGLDIWRMTLQEITFIGIYKYTAHDFRDTALAIFEGRLGPLDWAQPLFEGAQAFADLRAGAIAAPKIFLNPWL